MTKPKKKKEKKTKADTAWKDLLEELFESFLEFFFPKIHKDIDFSKGVRFLSTELRQMFPEHDVGDQYADELVEVYLKNGEISCICVFIHIEVQGKKEKDFIIRMFTYHYHILDRYREKGIEAVSLAVLTDTDKDYRPYKMSNKRWDFELTFKIPLIKLVDYDTPEARAKLEKSESPWAMVVIAQLRSNKVRRKNPQTRFDAKFELIRECYNRGYSKEKIIALIKFIDWLILLPDDFQHELRDKVLNFEEKINMPYVSSFEIIAEKKALEKGVEKGVNKEKLETARRMIQENFSIKDIVKATNLTEKEIQKLMH